MLYKTLTLYTLFLITTINLWGQNLDITSLKKELENLANVKSSNDWNAYTIKYLNADSLVVYEIPYNSNNEIDSDIWDLAFYYHQYDDKGRKIESRYYDINGNLHFSDWPPIIKTQYDQHGNKTQVNYFNENEQQISRSEYRYDSQNRKIEFLTYDSDLTILQIKRSEYQEGGKVVIESTYNEENKLVINDQNICFRFTKYASQNRKKVIEKRYLDKDKNLVNVEDSIIHKEYAKVIYNYDLKQGWIKITYYDSENNQVSESWQLNSSSR